MIVIVIMILMDDYNHNYHDDNDYRGYNHGYNDYCDHND